MADLQVAEPYILLNEGGYATLDGDTYEGIARNYYPKWDGWSIIDAAKPLSHGELIPNPNLSSLVDAFYKTNFWNGIMGDSIENQGVATYLYDFYVNAMHNAVKCVQRVLGVTVDGGFGNGTLAAVNGYSGDLLADLHTERVRYYNAIATGNNAQFLNGWLNRANSLYEKLGGTIS